MRLPKQASGVRYLGPSDYTTIVTFVQPNNGNAQDGTPLAETTIASTWANITQWRGKQGQEKQTLSANSSYKIIVHYPKTWSIDTGMNILVRGQRHNIESFADPDGMRVELHIWSWVGSDTVVNNGG